LFSYFVTGYTFTSGSSVPATFDGKTITLSQTGGSNTGFNIELTIDVATLAQNVKYKAIYSFSED